MRKEETAAETTINKEKVDSIKASKVQALVNAYAALNNALIRKPLIPEEIAALTETARALEDLLH